MHKDLRLSRVSFMHMSDPKVTKVLLGATGPGATKKSKEQVKLTFGSMDTRLRGMDPSGQGGPKTLGQQARGRPQGYKTRPGVLSLSPAAKQSQRLGLGRWLGGQGKLVGPGEVARQPTLQVGQAATDDTTRGGGGESEKDKEQDWRSRDLKIGRKGNQGSQSH